jgi:Domain of unknown function (DUF4157)
MIRELQHLAPVSAAPPVLQRKCAACGSKTSPAAPCGSCAAEPSEDRANGLVRSALAGPARPLEPAFRSRMEGRFGEDLSGVRVHSDAAAGEAARAVGAAAFTLGERIVFQPQHYRSDGGGRRLIAHELAHVLQQRAGASGVQAMPAGRLRVGAADDPLEREADRIADAALAADGAPPGRVSAAPAEATIRRQQPPAAPAPAAPAAQPEPLDLTPDQRLLLQPAARAAAVRTQVAMFRTRGIVPPGQEGGTASRARNLARTMFQWPDPNMEQIGDILGNMAHRLMNPNVKVAAAGDTRCTTWEAFVIGNRPPIILCPSFFAATNTEEQRTRTLIHEAAHAVGIGDPAGESYCMIFDCTTSCGGFSAADSWAHYVHCLSDQRADQPPVHTVPVPPPGGRQP